MAKKFGVIGVDKLIDDAFEDDFSIGLVGFPGTYKTVFNYSFTEAGVSDKEPTIYFCSSEKATSLLNKFDKRGFAENKFLEIIDGYSWRLNGEYNKKGYYLEGSSLNEFLNVYDSVRKDVGDGGRLVIDSFFNLVDFADLSAINNLLRILLAEEKEGNNSVLITLTPDHRENLVNLVENYVDCLIELIRFSGKNFLRVHWIGDYEVDSSWYRYKVVEGFRESSSLNLEVKEKVDEDVDEKISKKSRVVG